MGSYAGQRRESSSVSGWIKFAFLGVIISFCFQGALCEEPTETQCRPYIEKALKEQHLELGEHIPEGPDDKELLNDQEEFPPTDELTDSTEGSVTNEDEGKSGDDDDNDDDDEAEIKTENEDDADENEDVKTEDEDDKNEQEDDKAEDGGDDANENEDVKTEDEDDKNEQEDDKAEDGGDDADDKNEKEEGEETEEDDAKVGEDDDKAEDEKEENAAAEDDDDDDKDSNLERTIDIETHEVEMDDDDNGDDDDDNNKTEEKDHMEDEKDEDEVEGQKDEDEKETEDKEGEKEVEDEQEDEQQVEGEQEEEEQAAADQEQDDEDDDDKEKHEEVPIKPDVHEYDTKKDDKKEELEKDEKDKDDDDQKELAATEGIEEEGKGDKDGDDKAEKESREESTDDEVEENIEKEDAMKLTSEAGEENEDKEDQETSDQEAPEEEELIKEMVIPDNLRPRDHIDKILKLEDSGVETILEKTIDTTLKALKGLYDNAIKPLEMLYKYRDLSNRHFGDPEIFSKPLILFMGPWSGGKSSTINYLLANEFSHTSLRTGAEPSPAYFNILMHGEQEEILDGTQLAADWTFSGLQKFGQGLLDRLKGIKLPNKLLEKVNIVEIPGILEIRKQVQRLFPFNDACQWFIDRADIIFLVYDPSKLDVGPETEAILDQLKGREYQTRIILNKADQVKPEELMRVQGTLIWNISPLMSSSEPPVMYSTSLWSLPYEVGAPTRLLQAQERAFLKDLREAIDKRVENKISSARRFAVRVRNHAKMVDCYLTTYYNHKSIFGNRKKISDDIVEYPQKYHIYEGLSTLTNISRYDLPDPDVYRDFFKINPLYEFKKLSETCTYFRGCPINKLDVAIAYDLPELVGKYKKAVESAKEQLQKENS